MARGTIWLARAKGYAEGSAKRAEGDGNGNPQARPRPLRQSGDAVNRRDFVLALTAAGISTALVPCGLASIVHPGRRFEVKVICGKVAIENGEVVVPVKAGFTIDSEEVSSDRFANEAALDFQLYDNLYIYGPDGEVFARCES